MICTLCNEEKEVFRGNRTQCHDCEKKMLRERVFFNTYGITVHERDQIFIDQGSVCAACGTNQSGSVKGWHLDHCHRTGAIRSVLCATCNIALGQVNDSIERLQSLIDYLRKCNDYPVRE